MPEYHFAVAGGHGAAFAHLRAILANDAAAVSHAHVIGDAYPQASAVTVGCDGRIIARVPVKLSATGGDVTGQIRESEILIAKSRRLLDATRPEAPVEPRPQGPRPGS